MNDKIYQALNEQIKHEFYSAQLYLSIASYFENIPLEGFSKWFRKQAEEEREHGMKIYQYILDRNRHVQLRAIDQPPAEFESIEAIFAKSLEHERKVSHWINEIYEMASLEKDHATHIFLQWFITEQVEEEKNAQDNLDQIRLIGDDKAALFVLDQNFAQKSS
ncbi:MAG: ferritin [Parachlamydia sp.]|jgi:ferritin|nr:ferritin [Parachlamydia sp.]